MGFSCGVPLLLTGSVLQAWMTQEGVSLSAIGLYSLVGLPYALKFFWAPVFDCYIPPLFGRRRGWLLLAQVCLILALIWLALNNPRQDLFLLALAACFVTFFSASQDIVVDAYRREDLSERQLGLGSVLYVNGYRVGMLLAGGGGLILADIYTFPQVYLLMAASLLVGLFATLFSREPPISSGTPRNLLDAVVLPLVDFFNRDKAWLILLFILLYKIGDQMASHMAMPFYLQTGFTRTEIGTVVKLFGFWAGIIGGLAGGIILLRIGIVRSLWYFGILQAVSTLGFSLLALIGPSIPWLAAVISCENICGGMGTSAYVAYMASLTNKNFTATQYALLSSCIGIPRTLAASPTGMMADFLGWPLFFLACTIAALPGLLLLPRVTALHQQDTPDDMQ